MWFGYGLALSPYPYTIMSTDFYNNKEEVLKPFTTAYKGSWGVREVGEQTIEPHMQIIVHAGLRGSLSWL